MEGAQQAEQAQQGAALAEQGQGDSAGAQESACCLPALAAHSPPAEQAAAAADGVALSDPFGSSASATRQAACGPLHRHTAGSSSGTPRSPSGAPRTSIFRVAAYTMGSSSGSGGQEAAGAAGSGGQEEAGAAGASGSRRTDSCAPLPNASMRKVGGRVRVGGGWVGGLVLGLAAVRFPVLGSVRWLLHVKQIYCT